jgi:hypothetical protein
MSDWPPELTAEQRVRVERLTAVLERIGVSDPEGWASSETREDIPQAARAMFLRMAWRQVIEPFREPNWIDESLEIYRNDPGGPLSEGAAAIEPMLDAGVTREDIALVAWTVAIRATFELVYHMEDYEPVEGAPGWLLVETDPATDEPTGRVVNGLHESVLETDPAGREARPRS